MTSSEFQTPQHTHNDPMNHFRTDMGFGSSPIHQQRLFNGQNAINTHPVTRSKRRNSEASHLSKKVKEDNSGSSSASSNTPLDQLTLQNINLEEYPQFHHPDGGIIQFTPIGNIRSVVDANNQITRVVEQESKFDLNNVDRGIDGYKIFLGSDPSSCCGHVNCSPSNEIECYMRNGYTNPTYYSNPVGCYTGEFDCDSDFDDDYDDDCHMH